MEDHEDYLPGEAPAAHKTTHQDGGTDEVNIEGLTGISSYMAAHLLLPTVHQDAPALILTHKGDAAAHHAKYTDGEAQAVADTQIATHTAIATAHQDAPALILTHKGDAAAHHAKYTDAEAEAQADARIAIHAALPTVHQDAPALILTHKGDASAHHAKYTDAEAKASFSPLTLHPSLFVPYFDSYDFQRDANVLKHRVTLTLQYFGCPVNLPNGVTVTKLTLYGFRNDAASQMDIKLRRTNLAGTVQDMASVVSDWTIGNSSKYDNSISYAIIDNTAYAYMIILYMDPNDSVDDCFLFGAKIDFTC